MTYPLGRKAPKETVCGKQALSCSEADTAIHYCCAACKILSPTVEALLTRKDFYSTLDYYKIPSQKNTAGDPYREYLEEAHLKDMAWEIFDTGESLGALGEAVREAEQAGDIAEAANLREQRNKLWDKILGLVEESESRAIKSKKKPNEYATSV